MFFSLCFLYFTPNLTKYVVVFGMSDLEKACSGRRRRASVQPRAPVYAVAVASVPETRGFVWKEIV